MVVCESTRVALGDKSVIVIKVPDAVIGDLHKRGDAIHQAGKEFKCEIVLLGAGTGGTVGNPDLCRSLGLQHFDPEKVRWSQWNMEE
jgi:hypothetical protein